MKTCKYGTNRVIEPKGVLPQAALKVDNTMEIYDNEILVENCIPFCEQKSRSNGMCDTITLYSTFRGISSCLL